MTNSHAVAAHTPQRFSRPRELVALRKRCIALRKACAVRAREESGAQGRYSKTCSRNHTSNDFGLSFDFDTRIQSGFDAALDAGVEVCTPFGSREASSATTVTRDALHGRELVLHRQKHAEQRSAER
jgi:hypothetical protein